MARATVSAPLLALGALGAGVLACGPGLEMRHESNLRFEHCYRLDMDPKIARSHREHCWRDWTGRYTADQPLDRVEYARRRVADLEGGDSRPVEVHSARADDGDRVFQEMGSAEPMAAPAPTNAHAPPPKIDPVAPVIPPPLAPPVAASARPGQECTDDCGRVLEECDRLCAAKQADCATCREDFRRCMRRCYE